MRNGHVDGRFNRIPGFSGEHFWILTGAWRIDPVKAMTEDVILDTENLYSVEGPECYYCEQPFTPLLASHRCPGECNEGE